MKINLTKYLLISLVLTIGYSTHGSPLDKKWQLHLPIITALSRLLATGPLQNLMNENVHAHLWSALSSGNIYAIKIFIQLGVDLNIQNQHGLTPLAMAIQMNRQDIVEILLKAGANPNITNNEGHTPLHFATEKGNKIIINQLLKAGSHPNIQNHSEVTPLQIAVEQGHLEIITLLINHINDATPYNDPMLLNLAALNEQFLAFILLLGHGMILNAMTIDNLNEHVLDQLTNLILVNNNHPNAPLQQAIQIEVDNYESPGLYMQHLTNLQQGLHRLMNEIIPYLNIDDNTKIHINEAINELLVQIDNALHAHAGQYNTKKAQR